MKSTLKFVLIFQHRHQALADIPGGAAVDGTKAQRISRGNIFGNIIDKNALPGMGVQRFQHTPEDLRRRLATAHLKGEKKCVK